MIFIDQCTGSKGKATRRGGGGDKSINNKSLLLFHLKDSTSWPASLRAADVTKLHPWNLKCKEGRGTSVSIKDSQVKAA